jgi:hypothetical protein
LIIEGQAEGVKMLNARNEVKMEADKKRGRPLGVGNRNRRKELQDKLSARSDDEDDMEVSPL